MRVQSSGETGDPFYYLEVRTGEVMSFGEEKNAGNITHNRVNTGIKITG